MLRRYPLVLSAVIASPADRTPHPRFGVLPLWEFLGPGRSLAVSVGPDRGWFSAAREHRLLAVEALRVLKSEFSADAITQRLLVAVPRSTGRVVIASDSPHVWLEGRHPGTPWLWYCPDVFHVLDAEPQVAGAPASVAPTRAETRAIEAFASAVRELKKENPPSIRAAFDYLVSYGGYGYDRGDFEAFKRALFRGRKKLAQALAREPSSTAETGDFYGR